MSTSADEVTPLHEDPIPQRSRGWRTAVLVAAVVITATVASVLVLVARQEPTATLSRSPEDVNRTVAATESSLVDFWRRELPAVYGVSFKPLGEGYLPKTPSSRPFTCGGQRETYADIRGNAFYCNPDDYIAYDRANLFPGLDQRFGSVGVAIVLAHETGHAVQARAGVHAPSLVIELQADCFAGAWLHFAQTSSADPVRVDASALDSAVATVLTLRDQPGTPASNPRAHGLGFDRVSAFQTGYEGGAPACARFPTEGVATTELPFHTAAEAASGGNAPYSQVVPLFAASLDAFWGVGLPRIAPGHPWNAPARRPVGQPPLPACPGASYDLLAAVGYCPSANAVSWADSLLRAGHELIGDFFTGTALSEAWGLAAQSQAGLPTGGARGGLQRDCFTGAWVATFPAGTSPLLLSPGDVDEVVATILASSFDEHGRHVTTRGSAFARTDALRIGIFGGIEACR